MALEEKTTPKKFKRYVARPDSYGVVTIPSAFIPTADMDEETGTWVGVIPEE